MNTLVSASGLAIAGRLEPTSLDIAAGQLVGLIGPNGGGKTSLLHALAGISPATGSVSVGGKSPRGLHPDKRQRLFTFLPASRDIAWPLSARDFISLDLPPHTVWETLAERLELGAFLDRRMDQLSTGERARIMVARALAPGPKLLLLDEPIANLDPYWQLQILDALRRQARDAGTAVIMAIHDLAAALDWSDRLLVVNEGVVIADGAPDVLRGTGVIDEIFRIQLSEPGQSVRPAGRRSWR